MELGELTIIKNYRTGEIKLFAGVMSARKFILEEKGGAERRGVWFEVK